jgi:DNA (cytosine-5)-methyltransferase 1|tara:strand:- start:1254 stop:1892 length:639 start_codon:yes stop_codon:yes gene_type:complete
MKILNLYACLGGNRYKWDEVTDVDVTAVEYDEELAKLYQERFPNDTVVVADAHQYLLDNYKQFDMIWSSPPCPTHSRSRFARRNTTTPAFPDMKLYQEIIFLEKWFEGKYVVENVIPYYDPLIPAKKRGRHLYWTNFNLPNVLSERESPDMENIKGYKLWSDFHDFDFGKYKGKQQRIKIARNLVDYEAGKTILETAIGVIKQNDVRQLTIL